MKEFVLLTGSGSIVDDDKVVSGVAGGEDVNECASCGAEEEDNLDSGDDSCDDDNESDNQGDNGVVDDDDCLW